MTEENTARAAKDDEDQDDKEPETLDEIRRHQDEHPEEAVESDEVRFPTWRFNEKGESRIVSSPQELEELEADGGDWQDTPHEAPIDVPSTGLRTFAAPVGTVDTSGLPARPDQPIVEPPRNLITGERLDRPNQDLPRPDRPDRPEPKDDDPDRPDNDLPGRGGRADRPNQDLPGRGGARPKPGGKKK